MTSDYCIVMADYNRWMNEKLYGLCAGIADSERKHDRGAFFKSIHGTLNHLLWGDRAWLTRFLGKDYRLFNHETHHRGQLTTLMMQAGVDPGETDLPWLPALYPAHGSVS